MRFFLISPHTLFVINPMNNLSFRHLIITGHIRPQVGTEKEKSSCEDSTNWVTQGGKRTRWGRGRQKKSQPEKRASTPPWYTALPSKKKPLSATISGSSGKWFSKNEKELKTKNKKQLQLASRVPQLPPFKYLTSCTQSGVMEGKSQQTGKYVCKDTGKEHFEIG